jgi:hypothetical protein
MIHRRLFGAALLAAAVSVSSLARDAIADCAHPPVALPGLSGVPVWLPSPLWTPATATNWRGQLNDPRWAGGPMQFFQNQTGGGFSDQYDAQYRVVYAPNTISIAIQARVDPNGIDGSDFVYFGISQPGSTVAHLFAIQPDNGTPAVTDPTGLVPHDAAFPRPNSTATVTYYKTLNTAVATGWCELYPLSSPATGTGPCGAAMAGPPPWLQNVATWTSSPGLDSTGWAVTLQIDTSSSGLGANGQPVQMFFGTAIELTSPPTATMVRLTSAPQTGTLVGATPANAAIATWTSFSALGGACPAGIEIQPTTVGVWDPTAMALTNAVNTYPTMTPPCPTCTNQFRVDVQNVPAAGTTGHPGPFAVRARIRVADWGATIADPNAPWDDFGIPAEVFSEPQSYFTAAGGWAWSQSGSTATIDYTCTVQGANRYCPFLASTTRHQCMLVEIGVDPAATASGAPGWNVQTAAVYRNMEFGTASTLSEPATISLKGLQKASGVAADRDVYLYVETSNMAAPGLKSMALAQQRLTAARQYAMNPPPVPPSVRGDNVSARASVASPDILSLPLLTGDQALTEAYPTYRVLPYYDSGKTVLVKGVAQKLLVPMAPFGFHVNHAGTLYGFTHSLRGLDAEIREIAPNFFVVHMRNEGVIHVQTTIRAEETPPGQPPGVTPVEHGHCNCDVVGAGRWPPLGIALGALGAITLLVRSRRRRR